MSRLRLVGMVRYYRLRHRDGCCGSDDPEECSCGAADAMAAVDEARDD